MIAPSQFGRTTTRLLLISLSLLASLAHAVEPRPVLLTGKHAAATLQAGFTTLRDLGTLAIVASSSDVGGFAHGSNTRELE